MASRRGIGAAAVAWAWATAVVVAVSVFLNTRMALPLGFSDEFTYAVLSARFGQESTLVGNPLVVTLDAPNRVFLALYGLLGSPPRPVFELARVLNSLLLALGMGVLFVAARAGRALAPAFAVGVAYGLGPQSTYTGYFAPETMYAVVFFLHATLAALALGREDARLAALAGAAVAVLSLIKPHGLPVAAVTVVFMGLHAARQRHADSRSLWLGCLGYLIALFVVRAVLSWALAPDVTAGNALTGSLYARFVDSMAAALVDPGRYAAFATLLAAHCAVAACLAGPALVAGLAQVPGRLAGDHGSARFAAALAGLTAWLAVALIVMTTVFTVAAEETNRLHVRYYGFCIPLLFVGLACLHANGLWSRSQQALGLAVWLLGIAGCGFLVDDYLRSPFDAAEFFLRPWVLPGVPLAGAVLALLAYRAGPRALLGTVFGAYLVMSVLAMVFDRHFQLRAPVAAEHHAARIAVALADHSNVPVIIVAPEGDRMGLPYVYRIASLATHRAGFLGLPVDGTSPARLPAGTVVVGTRAALASIGVTPIVEVEPFGVGKVGPGSAAAPAAGEMR
ncbi:MAG: hypothetical protein U1E63_07405 [Burkholderiales bacterium]